MSRLLSFFLVLLLAPALHAADEIDLSRLPAPANRKIDFAADVQPIFTKHCVSCHGPDKSKSDYRVDDKSVALKGGVIGGAIVPGKSGQSKLIHYVGRLDDDMLMPPKGKGLSDAEIGILRAWIDQGASWPDELATPKQPVLWSLAPLSKPEVPKAKRDGFSRTSIDAFILEKLAAKKLTPAPMADKRTLIRRVTLDLTGLPPTPAEVAAFVADESEAAWEKVVDRLLASPRYGERWARHWMDVIHFAESNGHDEDAPRNNAWPYRDYLIKAFNDDRPYGRFIEEQVAGDRLFPGDPQAFVGIALLAAGPWDGSSQMGIQDGTTDKKNAQYLDRDDMITTVIGTVSSMTVHCSRCHNHKFDPIPQSDYYALQAVFAGIDRVEKSYDADPKTSVKRAELLAKKAALEKGTLPRAELLDEAVTREVAALEKSAKEQPAWHVIDPATFTSTGGATLTKLEDKSILSGGKRPERDTVTITAAVKLKRITAVRLEVLTDDSLSMKGPGRQDNGNLHLTQFSVFATNAQGVAGAESSKPRPEKQPTVDRAADKQGAGASKTQPQPPTQLKIAKGTADFDQQGWTIAHALDGNPATAWGIYPQVGKSHHAVFELAVPFESGSEGVTLSFVLDQLHGGGHLIGRTRISVTDAANPAGIAPLPETITKILAIAPQERSEEQRAVLATHVLRRKVERELTLLPPQSRIYTVASEFPAEGNFKPAGKPREVFMLRRGDVLQPIEKATPGALSAIAKLESRFSISDADDEGARRAALAKWLSDRENVLTWRSIVNRVWHHHFGIGIVDTPNDFGKMGGKPSHPELLDYLAVTFRDDMGGSLKKLHRLIVTSGVYMQSSRHDESAALIDGDNRFLWRMNRTRLDAEQVRDAVLVFSGKMDFKMGGPSVKQFIESKGIHVTPNVDYTTFDPDHPSNYRRAIYRFIFRTLPDPLMDTLDCPDASLFAAKRASSVTALQALSMLNNRFMVRQYEHIAARLAAESKDVSGQVKLLYEWSLGRLPNESELKAVSEYAGKHGMANAVRVILNSNEYMFVN